MRRLVVVLMLGLVVAWWAPALVAWAAPGARIAVLVVGDLDDADAMAREANLRAALKELRSSGGLSGVSGLLDKLLRYDLQRADHEAPLARLGVTSGRTPQLMVVELDGQGRPSRVRWGMVVTDVAASVVALQQNLGVSGGQSVHSPSTSPSQAWRPASYPKSVERVNEKDGSVLVQVPAGAFRMGSADGFSDEMPVHSVTLPTYWIGKCEVTNAQFERFASATSYDAGSSWKEYAGKWGSKAPVVCVSWDDAQAYCRWAGLRLPTEAEWEKAARGTDGRTYPWGNEGPYGRVWFAANSGRRAHDVGSTPAGVSPYGCLDMAGNVWEWCQDWYDRYPGNTDMEDTYGTKNRALRGGSWGNDGRFLRSATRGLGNPGDRIILGGFRCALSGSPGP